MSLLAWLAWWFLLSLVLALMAGLLAITRRQDEQGWQIEQLRRSLRR